MEEYRIYPISEDIKLKRSRLFVKGPLPYLWLQKASRLNGKCLHVGIILWLISGMVKSNKFKLQNKFFKDFKISRTSVYCSLKKLETEGLISINKRSGKTHIIEIIH